MTGHIPNVTRTYSTVTFGLKFIGTFSKCPIFAAGYIVIIFLADISDVSDWSHWGYMTRAIQNVPNLLPLGTLGSHIG